ncbi:PD-(D/E)XK nuclease-like domain-containing protein [Shewanella surugensis]|uniref:PD-(D/E)XK nuclease-like domain-containing protein n=1 Tax=Shewanella surugensis TaxID=212020 RepID=A0ABT0L9Z1_9GAMM|nr:PD-(D/E)XK nuclease-like domain-containing protein [Shewanella surugensis]MCL1124483.1 PD-(D/E)XK nuclease-like domain-containing protein [Shewanella surugensis]
MKTQAFTVNFTPTARAKKLFTVEYIVDANSPKEAEAPATQLLEENDFTRSHYRKKAIIKPYVLPNEEAPKLEDAIKPQTEDSNEIASEVEVDPFEQFMDPKWTIERLNTALNKLAINETLIIDDLPNDIYHGCIGVSCSKLKTFIECPQKYQAKYVDCIIPEPKKAYFDMGSAIHTVVLEPHLFNSSYVCQSELIKTRRGKAWDEFKDKADTAGQIVLTKEQWDDMPILRQSLASNATAQALTHGGVSERSVFKRDSETNLIIKCRPDYQIDNLIVDLKSDASADPRFFGAKAKKLGYHVQDALYSDVTGADEFVFFVIESSRPFVITAPIILNSNVKRLGYLKYRKAMRELAHCLQSNIWPAYTHEPVTVELNKFEQEELEQLEDQIQMEHVA